jgi:hypothetical protein
MIVQVDKPDPKNVERFERLRRARRIVASTFFARHPHPADTARPISAPRAWLFAAWVALVTGAYFARMLGLW